MSLSVVQQRGRKAIQILKNDGILPLIYASGSLAARTVQQLIKETKLHYLRWRADDPSNYVVDLGNYELAVDLTDPGIGSDLALNGKREITITRAYHKELQALVEKANRPINILDIGANIGYHAIPPLIKFNNVHVYAIEVEPWNCRRLQQNIERNGVADHATVGCVGFGDENGEVELHISNHSNFHSIHQGNVEEKSDRFVETQTVPIRRGESWLTEHDVNQSDIDVLRIDVQGSEANVLRGLPDVDPSIVVCELHTRYLSEKEQQILKERFSGGKIVAAVKPGLEKELDVTDIDDALEYSSAEIILRL